MAVVLIKLKILKCTYLYLIFFTVYHIFNTFDVKCIQQLKCSTTDCLYMLMDSHFFYFLYRPVIITLPDRVGDYLRPVTITLSL